jgi:hypothetical protein
MVILIIIKILIFKIFYASLVQFKKNTQLLLKWEENIQYIKEFSVIPDSYLNNFSCQPDSSMCYCNSYKILIWFSKQ